MAETRFIPTAHEQLSAHTLDASQRAVLDAPLTQSAVVVGAPGSGKTSLVKALIAHRVEGGLSPDDIIILTPGRQAANRLRDVLATILHSATNGAMARTPMSLAFSLAAEKAARDGMEAPRLLTGSEQDQILRDLLEGDIADGTGPRWPESLSPEVRASRIFRTELRELFARCVDTQRLPGSDDLPTRLRELGTRAGREEWVAASEFWRTYIDTISQAKTHYFDSSEMVAIAALALRDPATMPQTKLVVVDDAQELTYGAANMLRAFADRGVPILLFGDPDVASTTFRGAVPNLLGEASTYLGVAVATHVLKNVHRHSTTIRMAVSAVTDRIGTASAGTQRQAAALTPSGRGLVAAPSSAAAVTLLERGSQSTEWAAVARILREHHIFGDIPYSRMVVIVRNGGLVSHVARALAVHEVPSRTLVSDRSLRDQPIVRALISVVDVALNRSPLTLALTNELLLSSLGGLSILDLRRLRLSLRHEELLAGGTRTGEELLPESIAAAGRLVSIDSRPARRAARFSQLLADTAALGATGGSIEELLWCVWEGSKLSDLWAADALGSGLVADDANRNLDSVMALFTSAKRFVEREPDRPAADFISELLAADIPEDTLAPQSLGQSVLVCTPTAVVGAEYDVVVVASLQEGIWPNLRLRGSLLHPQDIVEAHYAESPPVEDPRRQVVEDELRMFALSLSRATCHVLVTATRNEDAQPSPFFRLLASLEAKANPDLPAGFPSAPSTEWRRDLPQGRDVPLSLRGLVGELRRSLVEESGRESADRETEPVSAALVELAFAQVPGANPDGWYGLRGPSTDKPLVDFLAEPDQLVNVSPSKLEAWEKNQLGWFISSTVGSQSSTAMGVGSLFHSVIEAVGDKRMTALAPQDLWQPIHDRWHELSFEAPWESVREQRRAFKMVGALSAYLQEFEASGAQVVAVECEFTVPVGQARLHGFIDRVEKDRDGNIVIVDLKTGAVPSGKNAEDHPQLLCYQFALVHDGVDNVEPGSSLGGARLLYLRGKEKTASAQATEREKNPEVSADSASEVPPYTYKTLNQSALTHELNVEGIDPIVNMEERIKKAATGMAGSSFTFVVYTREERGEYDSKYESRIHVVKAVSA
ncbi:ATP-dependent DNA helicase [Alpinimonas psychrophila]|uniref:DNA 3'-5' helicase n=1 Tax=Alpinimonas psychrophila TaxID=748908 RepID=A0A7W3JS56_9MICO|nr:superfamily I DNA/RNA helicase/RecB family exonuclease [Alpinimonas psychrophila]